MFFRVVLFLGVCCGYFEFEFGELYRVVSQREAAQVLYVLVGRGVRPGVFLESLIESMDVAGAYDLMMLGRVL